MSEPASKLPDRPRPDAPWSALVVDDDAGIRQSLRLCLEAAGARVLGVGTAAAAFDALGRTPFDLIFLDLWLGAESGLASLPEIVRRQPEAGVVVITAYASFETAVEAIRRGAVDYLPKPFTPDQVRLAATRVLENRRLRHRVSELERRLADADPEAWFESDNVAFRAFVAGARRAADADAAILLRGESGTGKSQLAGWLHELGGRRDRPFVTLHGPTASADQVAGALAEPPGAAGGTLFIDEVGGLSLEAQAPLLRHLSQRGGASSETSAHRLIAASNRPLEELAAAGRFRDDLLFRLSVLSLRVPPLRERPEDVAPLADRFLASFAARRGRPELRFSDAARAAMRDHAWPGNTRQLRNAVERAVILAATSVIEPADLALEGAAAEPAIAVGAACSIDELEREHIARVVARAPSMEAAARTLGIDATTLARKRKRYGLT